MSVDAQCDFSSTHEKTLTTMDEHMTVADMLAATIELVDICQTGCAISLRAPDSMVASLMTSMSMCATEFEDVVHIARDNTVRLTQTHLEELKSGSITRYRLMLQLLQDFQMIHKDGIWITSDEANIGPAEVEAMQRRLRLYDFGMLRADIARSRRQQDGHVVDCTELSSTADQEKLSTRIREDLFSRPKQGPSRTRPAPPDLYRTKLTSQPDRKLDGVVSNWADFSLLRTWMQQCDRTHRDHCQLSPAEADIFNARPRWLIDVQKSCLVSGYTAEDYITLSYVWGTAKKRFLAHKAIFDDMLIEGYFAQDTIRAQLPRTLIDSMALTLLLGQRYLWIDCVCIVQDDEAHRTQQISAMASIYVNSRLTIVAIGGGANLGLHGIPGGSPFESSPSASPALLHDAIEQHHDEVTNSPWSTRGWTFQEQILSRRIMVFTERGVTWECHCAVWLHGMDPVDGQCGVFDRVASAGSALVSRPSLEQYGQHVRAYNKRQLSNVEDITHAFAGILTTLGARFEGGFICGLPASHFDSGLLWRNADLSSIRPLKPSKFHGRFDLPSWSWMSWPVDLVLDMWTDECHKELKPLVKWRYKVNLGQAWIPINLFPTSTGMVDNDSQSRDDEVVLPAWDIHHCPLYLHTRVERAFFTIDSASVMQGERTGVHGKSSRDVSNPSIASGIHTSDGDPAGILISNRQVDSTRCELVAISQTSVPLVLKGASIPTVLADTDDFNSDDVNCRVSETCCYYNVLSISWYKGVAYRRGIGQVTKQVWSKERQAGRVRNIDLVLG